MPPAMPSLQTPSPDALPLVQAVQEQLRTQHLGRPMEGYAALPSTNERALAWARSGAPEGSTVLTDHQTKGRGRHGRRWNSQAGQNVTFSVILRPFESAGSARAPFPPHHLGLVMLAGALAVCEVAAEVVQAPAPQIKWPNDVLIDEGKCCGILAETTSSGTNRGPLVLGIGLNVNQRAFPEVPRTRTPPTSLALAAGRPLPRPPLLAQLLLRIERHYLSLFEDGGRAVRQACSAHLALLDQQVAVRRTDSGRHMEGTFVGLAPDGAMRLRTARGEEIIHAGDATTRDLSSTAGD